MATILAPAVVLFWLLPHASPWTIGNDHTLFTIDAQMELKYALEKGTSALFVPGFAGGQSSAALTLGQSLHPISFVAWLIPGYWSGHALLINVVLKLLTLGVAQGVLFTLLRYLRLSAVLAFVLSFAAVYNQRTLDMFRYGAALENYTGFVFLSVAVVFLFVSRSRRLAPLGVAFSAFWALTGGHPQMAYYAMLGAALIALLTPFVISRFQGQAKPSWLDVVRYYCRVLAWVLVGGLLAAAYLVPSYFEFVRENSARATRAYQWSLAATDTWGGTLNNLFSPLQSDVHSAFGGTVPLLLGACLPLVRLCGRRIPVAIWMLWGSALLTGACAMGNATPIHRWFWEFVPLASTFRVPGRITLYLPVVLVLVAAWMLQGPTYRINLGRSRETVSGYVWATCAVALCYMTYHALLLLNLVPAPAASPPEMITFVPEWALPATALLGAASLLLLIAYGLCVRHPRLAWWCGTLLCMSVVAQAAIQMRYGTWIEERRPSRTLAQLNQAKHYSLAFVGESGIGLESRSTTEQRRRTAVNPQLARLYRRFIPVRTQGEAYDYLARAANSKTAVVEIDHSPPVPEPRALSQRGADTVTLTYSSYNLVKFDLQAVGGGLVAVNFPFSERWSARLDDEEVPIYRANGNELSVLVPPQRHRLTLSYHSPSSVVGALLSSLGFSVCLLTMAFRSRWPVRVRTLVMPVLALAPFGIFAGWYAHLYRGEDLATSYAWNSSLFADESNLAFGRRATMSSSTGYEHWPTRAVDGARLGQVAKTDREQSPWWQVDLGSQQTIRRVHVYCAGSCPRLRLLTAASGYPHNPARPTSVQGTADEVTFLFTQLEARVLRLQSLESGSLSLREVEVYGDTEAGVR